MVTKSQRLTWEGLFHRFKTSFAHITTVKTKDRWWEWNVQYECPTADKTLNYFYAFALVEMTIQDRSWLNCWRGKQNANTWFELRRPDWGNGHEVNVDPRYESEVVPKLEQIEREFGCRFVVKTEP